MDGWLLAFLLVNAALIGAASVYAVGHALAHFRPSRHDGEKRAVQATVKLPPEEREKLLENARRTYRKVLTGAAEQLQLDLGQTAAALNKRLEQLGRDIVDDELKRYKSSLDELQHQADDALRATHDTIAGHQEAMRQQLAEQQAAMLAQMQADVETEKKRLLAQIDTRLGDAAASFLVESLGSDVDLGAQLPSLIAQIESNKDEFKKQVGTDD